MKDFFSKCDQIRSLRSWSHLLKKSLIENFIFSAGLVGQNFNKYLPELYTEPSQILTFLQQ